MAGVKKTVIGVKKTVIKKGDGKTYPKAGDELTMHYTGYLHGKPDKVQLNLRISTKDQNSFAGL